MSIPLEIEVKFFLVDPEPLRRRLEALGARSSGRCFESNLRFDDGSRSLRRRGALLRLRKDRETILTFKDRGPDDTEFKVHRELEVNVSDFDRAMQILQALGFDPVQRYEKWRETYRLEETEFCLDTLPFGEFLEIEGEKDAIRRYAGRLGLRWESRILDNYLAIFSLLKERRGLGFTDVTFDNFKGLDADLGPLAASLQAGGKAS